MTQISKGDTFVDGQQVTGARLNQLVDSSVLLVGAITAQPALTPNTVANIDQILIHDFSTSSLRKTSINDVLNSGLNTTFGSVSTSMLTSASSTISFQTGKDVDINGALEVNSINCIGALSVNTNLAVTGTTTLTGNATANGSFTSNGTANFTGAFQINGSVGYVLYEIATLTLPAPVSINAITNSNVATTANFGAKPSDEIWVFKCRFNYLVNGYPFKVGVRYSTETIYSGNYLAIESRQDASGGSAFAYTHFNHEWVIPQGTALSGTTLSVDVSNSGGSGEIFSISKNMDGIGTASWAGNSTLPPVIFIYKYKTA